MPDYNLGKIYLIECMNTKQKYYGSTCEPTLWRRISAHRASFKVNQKNGRQFCCSFIILNNDNFNISLIENYPCNNRDELNAREKFHISSNDCVNKQYKNNSNNKLIIDYKMNNPVPYISAPYKPIKHNPYNPANLCYTQDIIDNMVEINQSKIRV